MGRGKGNQFKWALAGQIITLKLAAEGDRRVVKWIPATPRTWDRNCNCPGLNSHSRQVGFARAATSLAGTGLCRTFGTAGSCGLFTRSNLGLLIGRRGDKYKNCLPRTPESYLSLGTNWSWCHGKCQIPEVGILVVAPNRESKIFRSRSDRETIGARIGYESIYRGAYANAWNGVRKRSPPNPNSSKCGGINCGRLQR